MGLFPSSGLWLCAGWWLIFLIFMISWLTVDRFIMDSMSARLGGAFFLFAFIVFDTGSCLLMLRMGFTVLLFLLFLFILVLWFLFFFALFLFGCIEYMIPVSVLTLAPPFGWPFSAPVDTLPVVVPGVFLSACGVWAGFFGSGCVGLGFLLLAAVVGLAPGSKLMK